jgi:uncharacterized membrane protein YgcG
MLPHDNRVERMLEVRARKTHDDGQGSRGAEGGGGGGGGIKCSGGKEEGGGGGEVACGVRMKGQRSQESEMSQG